MATCSMKNSDERACEFCNLRVDCALRDILLKLKELETAVAEIKAAQAG